MSCHRDELSRVETEASGRAAAARADAEGHLDGQAAAHDRALRQLQLETEQAGAYTPLPLGAYTPSSP